MSDTLEVTSESCGTSILETVSLTISIVICFSLFISIKANNYDTKLSDSDHIALLIENFDHTKGKPKFIDIRKGGVNKHSSVEYEVTIYVGQDEDIEEFMEKTTAKDSAYVIGLKNLICKNSVMVKSFYEGLPIYLNGIVFKQVGTKKDNYKYVETGLDDCSKYQRFKGYLRHTINEIVR